MANERTLLSYIRTALGFFIVGIPAVWWMEGSGIQTLGVVSLVTGVVVLGVGIRRFFTIKAEPVWRQLMRCDLLAVVLVMFGISQEEYQQQASDMLIGVPTDPRGVAGLTTETGPSDINNIVGGLPRTDSAP